MANESIVVIGAGIAGVAAAIALAQKGCRITIFEQAVNFNEAGAGVQLAPNAIRALKSLGCWDQCKTLAHFPKAIHMRDGLSGRLLKTLQLAERFKAAYGEDYCVMHRADLHGTLVRRAQAVGTIDFQLGAKINASDVELRHAAVIAADGINSATRRTLFANSAPRVLQYGIHRSLMSTVPAISGLEMQNVNLWLLPGGHLVHYPAGRPQQLNIVAVSASGTMQGVFDKVAAPLRQLISAVPSWKQWPAAYVPSLQHWHRGNICLIGDAAHGTVPFLAQGAGMALEDAVTLGTHWGDKDSFARFQAARQARTTRLDRQSRDMPEIYHAQGLMKVARNAALRLAPDALLERRVRWLYTA